jgi:hypothetical protein
MLTVDFDHELLRHAGEISEVRPDRMLTAKLDAVDPTIADQIPTDLLSSAAIATQLAGFRDLVHAPSPSLSP